MCLVPNNFFLVSKKNKIIYMAKEGSRSFFLFLPAVQDIDAAKSATTVPPMIT